MLGTYAVTVPETCGESVSEQCFASARDSTSSRLRNIIEPDDPKTIGSIETSASFYKVGSFYAAVVPTSGNLFTPARLWLKSSLEEEFQNCATAWKRDTGHLSVEGEIASHEAYQRIIRMGENAIPLILKDLMRESHHWFVALDELTGESPELLEEDRGSIESLSNAWVEWGKSRGYVD